jgi:anion-transporting  ArsA/GET3 family ATPase
MSTSRESPVMNLLREKKLLICVGAGGVGKTTTAASLALAAARLGRRTLVLTIDPSKRLAQSLGVDRNSPEPVRLSDEVVRLAGIPDPSLLEAWMLDPRHVSDRAVRKLVPDPELAEKLIRNRLYQEVTRMVAGMQEYTAMKALHQFDRDGRYDLIVLDTPPSRHALDFLDAPTRVAEFLEGRIFRMFLPDPSKPDGPGGLLRRAASTLVQRVISTTLGEDIGEDLIEFFHRFSGVFSRLNQDLQEIRAKIASPATGFFIVTSPDPAAVGEAEFFHDRMLAQGLPLAGFLLNRSRAALVDAPRLRDLLPLKPELASKGNALDLERFESVEAHEHAEALRDQKILEKLQERAGQEAEGGAFALALPWLPPQLDGIPQLIRLGEGMTVARHG